LTLKKVSISQFSLPHRPFSEEMQGRIRVSGEYVINDITVQ